MARRWMEETGKRVYRLPAMLYHPKYPFAHADVDRMVMGENAGLECKTTFSLDLKQFNGVEFPVQYYAQCVHYLAVTGADRWYLAVLAYGRGFFTFVLERDQAEIDALMAAEADFWKLVEQDTPPDADGSEATSAALREVYPISEQTTADLFGRDTVLREYMRLKEDKRCWIPGSEKLRIPSRRTWAKRKAAFVAASISVGNLRTGRPFRQRSLPRTTPALIWPLLQKYKPPFL